MLLLNLDESSRTPPYQQIFLQMKDKIELQVLRPGDKLPSTRKLAEQLGVHRSTVASAYQELWAQGYIEQRHGCRPVLRERMQMATAKDREQEGWVRWQAVTSAASVSLWEQCREMKPAIAGETGGEVIDFSSLDMDGRLFPVDHFRVCLDRALKKEGTALLGYGDRAGYMPLREYIAGHLRSHGITIAAEEILITNGLQQGIDLVFRMLAASGQAVAIESPTYNKIIPLLRFCGLKPLEVPVRHDGMDLTMLEEVLRREKPVLVYTMPNSQNPTGISTSQTHREQLLSLCETYRVPILEDGFEEEMKYFGKAALPIKSMDKHHLVIYAGTFSKVLFPGVRIGWIAAERECIDRLLSIRYFSDTSSSMILQAGIYKFCQSGHYARHINKMRRVFRSRMQTAIKAFDEYIAPDWAEWIQPSGGYLIWMKLKSPAPVRRDEWESLMAGKGVCAAWGTLFFAGETGESHIRLSISKLNEQEIETGICRLGDVLREVWNNKT